MKLITIHPRITPAQKKKVDRHVKYTKKKSKFHPKGSQAAVIGMMIDYYPDNHQEN